MDVNYLECVIPKKIEKLYAHAVQRRNITTSEGGVIQIWRCPSGCWFVRPDVPPSQTC